MPTMIAKLGREKTIAALAKRIYAIEGRNAAKLQRQAEIALLAANPRLSKKEGFRSGAPIGVPRVTGLKIKAEVDEAKADGTGIVQESSLRLELLAGRIEGGFRTSLTRKEDAIARLGDREFVGQAIKALPEARALFTTAADRLKQQAAKDQEEAERFASVLKQAQEGLAALNKISSKLPRG